MKFLVNTIKGGFLFLLPIVLIIFLCQKALAFVSPLAAFFSQKLDPEDKVTFDLSYVISITLLILVCFLCGLLAVSRMGKSMVRWLERNVLSLFPGYEMMKRNMESAVGLNPEKDYPVVLAPVDGWQIAFVVEKLPDETHVVFVPGSPSPWDGSVMMFAPSDLKTTTLTQKEALSILRHTGIGMKDRVFQTKSGDTSEQYFDV
jgi:uncharacterized membrane protein